MGLEHLADDVKRFLLTSVPSVPFLEAMLLMDREPSVEWDSTRLAKRLYMSEKAASKVLLELRDAAMLLPVEGAGTRYHYAPASSSLRELIPRIADAYVHHLVAVTNLIHSSTRIHEIKQSRPLDGTRKE